MVVFWLSERRSERAIKNDTDGRPLKRARTDELDHAGCDSGWVPWDGWATFYDLQSRLHRRFLGQISSRPN